MDLEETRKKIEEYYEKAIHGDEETKLVLKKFEEITEQFDKIMEKNWNEIKSLIQINESKIGPIANTEILKYLSLSMYYHKLMARNQNALGEAIIKLQNMVHFYQKVYMEMYALLFAELRNISSKAEDEKNKQTLKFLEEQIREMQDKMVHVKEINKILKEMQQGSEEIDKSYKGGMEVG